MEAQLQTAREKTEARSQKIDDLHSQLGSTIVERDALGKKFKIAKSVTKITRADAEEMVA